MVGVGEDLAHHVVFDPIGSVVHVVGVALDNCWVDVALDKLGGEVLIQVEE